MARYLDIAKRYQNLPVRLLELVPSEHKEEAAEIAARLVNAGMVGCPRPAQGTVRLNYVSAVCKNLPIVCSLEERKINPDDPTSETYKALVVKHKK